MFHPSAIRSVLSGIIVTILLFPYAVLAAPQFSAVPLVIDGTGKPRDIMRFGVTLTNTEPHMVNIYPWVSNFSSASGTQEMPDLSNADLSSSLANWIEVTRGVIDLMPGESRSVPILVQINLNAKPGIYHAHINFSTGSNRVDAESSVGRTLEIPINITVLDDANEKMQLGTFVPIKNWFIGKTAGFQYRLENIGNRGVVPKGKIRIYDRKGQEVATIDANQNGERLEPANTALLSAVWQSGDSFGKYKAMLDVEYGDGGRGTIQDTVFFWVMPWQKILGMFLSIVIASVIIAILIHSRSRSGLAYARAQAEYLEEQEPDGEFPEREPVDDSWEEQPKRSVVSDLVARFRRKDVMLDEVVLEETAPLERQQFTSSMLPERSLSGGNPARHQAVVLQARAAQQPNPEHIVNLKK